MSNDRILENTLLLLGRLQGIGPRSAKRILFDLMKKKDTLLSPLIDNLKELVDNISPCPECFNLDIVTPCHICTSKDRDMSSICVVEDIGSLWAIEKTNSFKGTYFVLGGNLSAYKGLKPENLNINILINRINKHSVKEVILATSMTIEGQITANYIVDNITNVETKVTMLAQGIPVGGEIDYLDEITLSTAIKLRKNM